MAGPTKKRGAGEWSVSVASHETAFELGSVT